MMTVPDNLSDEKRRWRSEAQTRTPVPSEEPRLPGEVSNGLLTLHRDLARSRWGLACWRGSSSRYSALFTAATQRLPCL